MSDPVLPWQIQSQVELPEWFAQAVGSHVPSGTGQYLAQLLWQRGIQAPEQLAGFLHSQNYTPASPFEFGQEMHWAVERLQRARVQQEPIAIWGDFDADGVTATAVLWEGLGQFFAQQKTLFYYIPNRLTESHGLSLQGIDLLHAKGCRLIVTCDTGSTNPVEIEYAQKQGMDVIVTDHHTLPADRPSVTAIINPRYLSVEHPLATLSGVAVAYKLVEALYETLPEMPQKPLEALLDLVAIGLIADLVELKGDCRYLAQRGIEQLQKQSDPATATRPGVAKLLEFCKRSGDRPTDISFGIGPRINAVSRIQGDAHFCVELLTSQDAHLCTTLAEATELANARRKALQKDVAEQVTERLARLDLSTTRVIVLADEQWPVGVLGLVAGQIAQEYGRPTILLSSEGGLLARGSARSLNNIDLYQLVKDQEHLLEKFGGHPYAAGLSLAVENLPLFTEAVNQTLRQAPDPAKPPALQVDLVVTVAELGKALFQELKLLEPCGMGNPAPKLLIQNCQFENVRNKNIQDRRGQKVRYIKTEFELWDDSSSEKFAGMWWGHYRDEVPQEQCDAVVELDFNTFRKRYEVRLVAVRSCEGTAQLQAASKTEWILDWREGGGKEDKGDKGDKGEIQNSSLSSPAFPLVMARCPSSWAELQAWLRRAKQEQRPLAIAYAPPTLTSPETLWQQLAGIAKYLSRTGQTATRAQLLEKLEIGDRTLQLGCKTLTYLGFTLSYVNNALQVNWQPTASEPDPQFSQAVEQFSIAFKEEQFRHQFFYQVSLSTIQAFASQTFSE